MGGGGGSGGGGLFGSGKQQEAKQFKQTWEAKTGEKEALQRLRGVAMGATKSQAYMKMFNDQAAQQAMAMAASQRGASNPALAFRQAQISNQQMGLQNAQQAAMMTIQERQNADAALIQAAAGQRGVALQSATANQTAQGQANQNQLNMIGSGVSGMGQAAVMASDEGAKENIKPKTYAMDEIESFLKVLKPSTYEYKDAKHGTGEKMGVMAQDLEKSTIGKTMVDTAPDGTKMVDTNKAIGAILAVLGDMNKQIKKK